MRSPFLVTSGVAAIAVGCACFHPSLPNWFGWVGVGTMAVGVIMAFIGNMPTIQR